MLLEGAGAGPGGETTEMDSDTALSEMEGVPRYELTAKEHEKLKKFVKIPEKAGSVTLPAPKIMKDKGSSTKKEPFTIYCELDDVFLHTFLCDENFGYMANPASKDPEYEFFVQETRQPVLVYERDCMIDFLNYLKDVKKDGVETVVYTNS